ncbi:MAG: DUF5069 domain-containing protein [Nitrospira sp.]|nr:DUF5069 domain-containing protein [Nitrospira sp.]MBX3334243.1 DUF5069 domain-containing protein [Nitrospira sp.]
MRNTLSVSLRSPRARLGGYVLLPRLIDKVRLQTRGQLPPEYEENLLSQDPTKMATSLLLPDWGPNNCGA